MQASTARSILLGLVWSIGGCRADGAIAVEGVRDRSALDGCARGDLAAQLAIVGDLRDSYHEMIVCGGLALDFDRAVGQVLVTAALGRERGSPLAYRGDGTYATPNGMMVLRATGADGQPLGFPLLDLESYFVGGRVTTDLAALAQALHGGDQATRRAKLANVPLDIEFTSEGPGLALFGFSPEEVARRRVRITPRQAADTLGAQIRVANRIDVANVHGGTDIHYLLDGKPQLVRDLVDHSAVPMELASIVATRADTGQTIRITEWTMQFEGDGGTVLDGTIALEVDGGAFPYAVRFSYPHRMEPTIDLACR